MLALLSAGLLFAAPAMAQAPAADAKRHPVVEQRIQVLRTRLKITPEETKPFDEFAQVMRENATRMDGLMQKRHQSAATMSAVDQMQSYGDIAQAHAEDMQRLIPAFSRLYQALSPAQQKLADQSFRQFVAGRQAGGA